MENTTSLNSIQSLQWRIVRFQDGLQGKYKKLKRHKRRATHWLGKIAKREPAMFAHCQLGVLPAAG